MILNRLSLCLLAGAIGVAGALPVFGRPFETLNGTDPCPAQQQAMEFLRARIKSDQQAIKRLGFGITANDLQEATDVAEQGRKEAILAAALSLLDGFLNTPEAALEKQTIAGYQLKNGLGSIGTGQANLMIGRIRAEGGVKEALIPALRNLSHISQKTSKLEYLKELSDVASALKSTAELGAGENSLEEAEALFGLAAAIAARGDLAVSLASAIVNSAKNQTQIYLMAKSIDRLTSTAESQLKDLQVLSAKLQTDVQTLQRFSATDICDTDVSWQIALQQQRMNAAAAGNIDFYNQLLRLHAQIFKQLSLKPCESGFYPGGCNSTPGAKGQRAQGTGASCPPFSPRNAQDAIQVEESSHKDVCWGYNGKTLIATSSETPEKANKPGLLTTESGAAASGLATQGGTGGGPTDTQDLSANTGKALQPLVTKVPGRTGVVVMSPKSISKMVPRLQANSSVLPSFDVFRPPCESYLLTWTGKDVRGNIRNQAVLGVTIGEQVSSIGGYVGDTDVVKVPPGQYCLGISLSGVVTWGLPVRGPNDRVSGLGFPPMMISIDRGHSTVVTVPMGILVLHSPPLKDSHTECRIWKDPGKMSLGDFEVEPTIIQPPYNRYALSPGSYTYSCSQVWRSPMGDDEGSFNTESGQVTDVPLP